MQTITKIKQDMKLSEITIRDLKEIIKDAVQELIDPDYGLQLKPEIETQLKESIKQKNRKLGVPLSEVKKNLGLE